MTILLITIAAIAWAICGWFSYRIDVAWMTRKHAHLHFSSPSRGMKYDGGEMLRKNRRVAALIALLGPAALMGTAVVFHGGLRYGLSIPTEGELRELALKERDTP